MTVLALRTSNVVQRREQAARGRVPARCGRTSIPGLPENEVPITSITNGVHTQTWVAPEIAALYDRYLGTPGRKSRPAFEVWKRAEHIPDAELWRTHERCRERLVALARTRLQRQRERLGATRADILAAEEVLDPEALTIGFARRFATYKRGTLVFRNLERLNAILNHKDRPVQLIFSGKAHPKDQGGKELIAQVAQFARRPEFRRRVVFLEDYDMNVARHLVQGVDVWLNNPRRPLEASGTSGMKVCVNGGLNLSILDGWWDEGYLRRQRLADRLRRGASRTSTTRTRSRASALYDLIEREIVPEFYTRGADGLPRGWIRRMKRSIATNVAVFNTNRMVREYTEVSYLPSHRPGRTAVGQRFRRRPATGRLAAEARRAVARGPRRGRHAAADRAAARRRRVHRPGPRSPGSLQPGRRRGPALPRRRSTRSARSPPRERPRLQPVGSPGGEPGGRLRRLGAVRGQRPVRVLGPRAAPARRTCRTRSSRGW